MDSASSALSYFDIVCTIIFGITSGLFSSYHFLIKLLVINNPYQITESETLFDCQ